MVASTVLYRLKLAETDFITRKLLRPPPLVPLLYNDALPDIAALPSSVRFHDDVMPRGFRAAARWFVSNLVDMVTGQYTWQDERAHRRGPGLTPAA